MEVVLVSGPLKVIGNKLAALITSKFASVMGVRKDLHELQQLLTEITRWFSRFEDKAIENDPSFCWTTKLKDLAYDIEDLLDEVHLEAEKHKIDIDADNHSTADCFCAKPMLFLFRCKVASKIKGIKVRFAAIVKQRSDINTVLDNSGVDPSVRSRPITGELSFISKVEEFSIPVRDKKKDDIISSLIDSDEGLNGWIVSIIGIGGSGKTTLAKLICLDKRTKEHFKDSILWVHVSQEFDLEKLIGKLFESIAKKKADRHTQQYMVNAISNRLSGKKFLLVLDDAWHDDRDDWKQFLVHIRSGAHGSRVLLTTRDQKVAEAVGSMCILNLEFLTESDSWIFFLKSSDQTQEDMDSEFVKVGKKIVNKCGGVPLAIRTLGGVLRDKREINTLKAIESSNLWNHQDIKDRVFASLQLSYFHLADHLKRCFTIFSIYPKGYGINKDHLIAQWIAHGFIHPMNACQLEDIGSDYFGSLVKVGFLQESPFKSQHTKQIAYRMHDLIHDLSRQILQHEMVTSLPRNMSGNSTYTCRYLSLNSCSEKVDGSLLNKARALYVSGGNLSFEKPFKKSCYVRSAILQYATDTPFPMFLLKFKFLGYLEMYNLRCSELPEAISSCQNLQTLHLVNCRGFVTLPDSIGKLMKLRTLELLQSTDLESLPESIGDCQNLQYLLLYLCEKLRELPNSVGKIESLRVLQVVKCHIVDTIELSGDLGRLQTINLAGCKSLRHLPSTFACETLRSLNLSHTNIAELPNWVTLNHNLESIDLSWCMELVDLPKDIVKLRRLEVLCLIGCHKLCCLPSGFGKLTCLRKLGLFVVGAGVDDARILELGNLKMISGRLEITNLQYLRNPSDAKNACLKQKNIEFLMLNWSQNQMEEASVSDMEHDLVVLDYLEPPSEIRELIIRGYRGLYLPRWMTKQSDSVPLSLFLCLTNLQLQQSPNLKHMRGLVQLPLLKKLRLCRMPNLEELQIITCASDVTEEEVCVQHYCFPLLTTLIIVDCPKLVVKPCFPSSLQRLSLKNSNYELLLSPECSSSHLLSHLKDLRLEGMAASMSGWELLHHLTGLESLEICLCNDLTQLPETIRSLRSLKRLEVKQCSNLVKFPEWLGQLSCLQQLLVLETPLMASLPQSTRQLTCLVRLHIGGWHNLKQLPEVIQHLTSLHTLRLEECSAMAVLPEWIGELSALRRLILERCTALESLPRSIQRRNRLQYLSIAGCPHLAGYKKQVGDEWHLLPIFLRSCFDQRCHRRCTIRL
ncbi:hypothetical protein SORBI_3005G076200 [Sorghum bicolor]|uniref:Uncharacterized protein n=1 Tax=Sorghum bicolor TaxID=4558 RepID=A0A1Z5RH55_SORBI|nr:hypothetical protein SORBI_3005G076200 [Sorghum bicolor]OQU83093.1 hypothetical protein SORBI_3005G076200 [Sorghum bicolor]